MFPSWQPMSRRSPIISVISSKSCRRGAHCWSPLIRHPSVISGRANSSSGFTEQWGVDLAGADLGARRRTQGLRMQYADLSDLLVILDICLGGGVQDVFRVGQNLIEIPGLRPPQT
jgi:hypothetical protein